MEISQNAFLSAILYCEEVEQHATIWSQTVCRAFKMHDFGTTPYPLGQLLEPSVLFEVAQLTKIPLDKLQQLDYENREKPLQQIQQRLAQIDSSSIVERLNLAYLCCSLSRFELAAEVITQVHVDELSVEDKIYYYLFQFYLQNRLSYPSSEKEFAAMKALFEQQALPDPLLLNVSSQAIVWQMKQKSVGDSSFYWFVEKGKEAATRLGEGKTFHDHKMLSSFFRAYAMIPAEKGDVLETRREMEKALYFAKQAQPQTSLEKCRKQDALKTVYESQIKEHMYVSKSFEQAEEAGYHLLETDPNWSISYQEMAECYLHWNKADSALQMLEQAKQLGPPRITVTHFMRGYCFGLLHRVEEAIAAFIDTLEVDPSNISAGINGFTLAKKANHPMESFFQSHLKQWDQEGLLEDIHRSFLVTQTTGVN